MTKLERFTSARGTALATLVAAALGAGACGDDTTGATDGTGTETDTEGATTGDGSASASASATQTGTGTTGTDPSATTDPGTSTTSTASTEPATGSSGPTTTGDPSTTTGVDSESDTDTDTGETGGPWDGLFPVDVGDVGPIDPENPLQYPFACRTEDIGLGQPEVDNEDGIGLPIVDENDEIIGYSQHCGAKTRVDYFYMPTGAPPDSGLTVLPDPLNLPDDVATLDIDGESYNYIVRYERGTINRFVYGIGVLEPNPGDPNQPDTSAWNQKLIFWFGGGVGIGHQQSSGLGVNRLKDAVAQNPYKDGPLYQPLLERGYAIVYSSGTVTDTTYNLRLTGITAEMTKEQFRTRYGDPKYTFGIGGSGGAIQQYIYEQNHPELLDGLVPTHAYADMITQTNRVGDCELLEYYFDITDGDDPLWKDWENRQLIEGFHAINGFEGSGWDFLQEGKPLGSTAGPGSSECIEGWRGLSPLAMNPHWVAVEDSHAQILEHDPEAFLATAWTYPDDLIDIFGVDPESAHGYARTTMDNVGVQYGLQALLDGDISKQEFLDLNANVGGWRTPDDMVQEGFPFYGDDPLDLDIWSSRNSTATDGLAVAPRRAGDIEAMHAAYYGGLVYLGGITDPIINIMPYLEPHLDMHNSKQPFIIRQRMEDAQGGAVPNLVIWGLGDSSDDLGALILQAFETLELWLDEDQAPEAAIDTCFGDGLDLIASGDDVWNGVTTDDVLDNGPCAETYPVYRGPRIVAGEDFSADIFKCQTKPLATALEDGTYGGIEFEPDELTQLSAIFGISGVCDYTLPDAGRPDDI